MKGLSPKVRAIIDANAPPEDRPYYYRMAAKEGAGGGVSSTGAAGLFQFTRGTGQAYGLLGPDGDIREDDVANTKAMVKLTNDNRNALRDRLGREPTFSELALAHQQGAHTAANMLKGTGNASDFNLSVNNVAPGTAPQDAARKIMNYYGFEGMPGISMMGVPQSFDQGPEGAVPFAGLMPGLGVQGTSLATPPPAAEPSLKDRLLADIRGGKDTPYAKITEGLGEISQAANPNRVASASGGKLDATTISPMSSYDPKAASGVLSQGLLTQMITSLRNRRGAP